MNSRKLVAQTILGNNTKGPTPVYGWVSANIGISKPIIDTFGSVENFEDKYAFDMAHIFGGPGPYNNDAFNKIRQSGEELTPDKVLEIPFLSPDNMGDYNNIVNALNFHQKTRDRFCYMQTNGIFECVNGIFGIEDHLCYMALYQEEIKEIYRRQAQWNKRFAEHVIELGVDMVHISDDWGAQKTLMFSKDMWKTMIYPAHKVVCDFVREKGCFLSLHSDGNVMSVIDGIADLGFQMFHPFQESAGMDYNTYLNKYQDKFGLIGGLCIQSTLGFNNYERLGSEIKRVFSLLKGKRWCFCTTHFVQDHCSIEELVYAYDLAVKLARP